MKPPGQARRTAVLLVVLAALLGLSGCFTANQDVTVKRDGTGSVVIHAEVDKKALADIARTLGDIYGGGGTLDTQAFKPVDTTFPDGTRVRAVDGVDRATLDASFDFNGPDEYQRKLAEVGQAVATNPDAALADDGSIRIRRVGERMEVALDLGSSGAASGLDLSVLDGLLGPSVRPELVFTITMPGSIVTTNGTASGRKATWDLLRPGAPSMLTVTSEVASPALPVWAVPAGAGLIVLLFLAIVGVVVSQRRRGAAQAEAVVPYPPMPPGGAGTFFPPAAGLPAREPVGWPAPPAPPPPWLPSGPPPTQAPAPAWPQPPGPQGGFPAREPVGPDPTPTPSPWTAPPSGPEPAAPPRSPPAPPSPWSASPPGGADAVPGGHEPAARPTADAWAAPAPTPPPAAAGDASAGWGPAPPPPPGAEEATEGWAGPQASPQPAAGGATDGWGPAPTPPPGAGEATEGWAGAAPLPQPAAGAGAAGAGRVVEIPAPPLAGELPPVAAASTPEDARAWRVAPSEPVPAGDDVPTAAMPAVSAPEAGWYADPAGGTGARYWDGHQWTQHIAPGP